jgi:hypothetical protein
VLGFKVSGVLRLILLQDMIINLKNLAQVFHLPYKAKLMLDQGKFA